MMRKSIRRNEMNAPSADELIASVVEKTWAPPSSLVSSLDKILAHNNQHPDARVGVRKIAAWLGQHGVAVGRDALDRWIKNRVSKKHEER